MFIVIRYIHVIYGYRCTMYNANDILFFEQK